MDLVINWRRRWVVATITAVAGCLAFFLPPHVQAEAAADNSPVRLPPFIVQDSRFKVSLWNWGYMAFPGYEVLTGCGRGMSNEFVMGAARQFSIMREIAPAAFEGQASVPTSLILMNAEQAQAISEDMRKVMAERPAGSNSGSGIPDSRLIYFPQLRLHDSESTAVNLVLGDPRVSQVVILEPGYVRYLMQSRTPRLPAWYVEAMTDLYRNAVFSSAAVNTDPQGRLTLGATSVTFSPVSWISDKDSKTLRDDPALGHSLLPMETILFTHPEGSDGHSAALARLWRAQSDLFLQWAIADKNRTRIDALRKFLDLGDKGRRDENAFRECFGLGFAQTREELGESLLTTMERSITWYSDGGDVDEVYRDATRAETARIWGNWELLEVRYVRAKDPLMIYPYANQAEHTLGDAFRKGERDPGVLAVQGLFECEMNMPEKALPILESAAEGRAAYPRVYTELARIRLKDALARPAGADGKLGPDQTASILALLKAARALTPPQGATYMIYALALGNSSIAPNSGDLAVLDEGQVDFPADSDLATLAGALRHTHGANGVPAESNAR